MMASRRIANQIPDTNLVLSPPKSITKIENYRRADYAELLCLFNKDRLITRSEVAHRLGMEDDINDNVEPYDDEEEFGEIGSDGAEINDIREVVDTDWFGCVRNRSVNFGTSYPFLIDDDGTYIKLKRVLTNSQYAYILMLLASNISITGNPGNTLTSSFERLCVDALKVYLPQGAEVHNFGAGLGSMRISKKYSRGNLLDRIHQLGRDLSLEVITKSEELRNNRNGDGGLDIVAWIPTKDRKAGKVTIFGQCACTTKWDEKLFTSSFPKWRNRLKFIGSIVNCAFVPLCYRDAKGDWHDTDPMNDAIVFDRLRLIHLLGSRYVGIKDLTAFPQMKIMLKKYEEDVA